MSDNLFSFPSESTGPADGFGVFSDLGSDDSMEDPFAMPETAAPFEAAQPLEPEANIQEPPPSSIEQPPEPEATGPSQATATETVPPSEEPPQTPPAQAAAESGNPILAAIDIQ